MNYAAVLFDNDGLLLDSESVWTRAEEDLFARRGREFTLEHKQQLVGTSPQVSAVKLEEMLGEDGWAVLDELHDLVLAAAAKGIDPMPGALELLRALDGVPHGVASNSPRVFVDTALKAANLAGRFAVVLSADDVEHPKPAPDLYVELARRLGADPADCVAFEDSPTGVAAAKAAGAYVIAVPSLPGVDLSAADVVIGSLHEAKAHLGL